MNRTEIVNDSDRALEVLGVPGRLTHRTVSERSREYDQWESQRWVSQQRKVQGYGLGAWMTVEIRFDDSCGNRRASFAVTAEVRRPGGRDIEAGGCLHEEIARYFPELRPLLKWHLMMQDGPMHYPANAVYHAGDRDHNGLRAGDRRQMVSGRSKKPMWKLVAADPDQALISKTPTGAAADHTRLPLYLLDQLISGDCDQLPAVPRLEWIPCWTEGEGKARDLDAARSCAVWPEATDDELSVEPDALRATLAARLPALLQAFREDITRIGFYWSPSEYRAAVKA